MVDPNKYQVVRFQKVDGIHVATQPWPRAFLASREFLRVAQGDLGIELLRPLTLRTLLLVVGQNWITQLVWRARRACWRLGFLDAHEALPFAEASWRWRFWRPRQGTQPSRGA